MKLSCSEFAQMFDRTPQGDKILIDVRNKDEVAQGSIPGSINIPIVDLESRVGEISVEKQIFIYCKSGGRAEKAKNFLDHHGFTRIRIVVDGGYEELKSLIK